MKKAAPTRVMLAMTAAMTLTANAVAQEVPATIEQDAATPAVSDLASAESAVLPEAAPAGATPADAATGTDGVFQVIRPGDSRLSCEALLAEANALNGQINEMQSAATNRAMEMSRSQIRGARMQSGASAALSLGSMAAALVPGAALAMGAAQSVAGLAQQAAAEAQQQRRMDAIDQMMADAEASAELMMPLMNRADHLTDLSMAKGC